MEPGYYDAFLGDKGYKTSANMMLAAGAVVMVVGFLGCCGAARESRMMLGWVRSFLLNLNLNFVIAVLSEHYPNVALFYYKNETMSSLLFCTHF